VVEEWLAEHDDQYWIRLGVTADGRLNVRATQRDNNGTVCC
jgi:hypothetical protein